MLGPGIFIVKPVPIVTVAVVKVTSELKLIVVAPNVVNGVDDVKVTDFWKVMVTMLTKVMVLEKVTLLVKVKEVGVAEVMFVSAPVKPKRGVN